LTTTVATATTLISTTTTTAAATKQTLHLPVATTAATNEPAVAATAAATEEGSYLWARSNVCPRKSYWRGRLSTIDLLMLTSLDQLLFMLKILFTFLQNKLTQWGGQMYCAFRLS
jgi:hypothetical protein